MHKKKMHRGIGDAPERTPERGTTLCGLETTADYLTWDDTLVTCGNCQVRRRAALRRHRQAAAE